MTAVDAVQRAAGFCERHGIASITLTPMAGVTTAHRVCDLDIAFAADDSHSAYHAQFKLQGREANIGDRVNRVHASGEIEFHDEGSPSLELDAQLASFFRAITSRVKKVQHEQSIQNVTFLGNSFLLNGRTVFTVVADDDGRLDIELHKGNERQPAVLIASSLLDGLYDGSIELLGSS